MEQPYLLFEFMNSTGVKTPYLFTKPVQIFEVHQLVDVEVVFSNIEQALQDGYYVAGFVSYEAAPAFDRHYDTHPKGNLPLVWFGIFEKPHKFNEVDQERDYKVSDWKLTSNFEDYQQGIQKIKDAIEVGNTYQVNYTARLEATFQGDDFSFYRQLTRNQQSSYSAYINIGRYRILSASPELFFHVEHNRISTKPMKGTAKRGRFLQEDKKYKDQLSQSEKDQAENLMIVDLLRNDIGRIAKPGTVNVPKLFEIESYPTVHQMTSTITAEIQNNTTVLDWFKALFPCGSITGAPKIRTMEYIAELEQTPREVYCGAIGFITPEREAIFNVPIRTVTIDTLTQKAIYGAGGGVTWDSTASGEYEELLTKAQLLTEKRKEFQLLESLRLENGEYPLRDYHMKRLVGSSYYFGYELAVKNVELRLDDLASQYPKGTYKARLLVEKDGNMSVEAQPVKDLKQPISCTLARGPVDLQNPFLFHKTTYRDMYEQHNDDQYFTTLLWNEQHEITEFTIGNIVLELHGEYFTPPIESGLLSGTYRQYLLDHDVIKEKIIKKEEVKHYDRIWFINSVRGWVEVKLDV
ncbi:aminodeoxychorismate synthase component I [Aquibacillus koreensis]|uniref:Aminodeoxychorismate synthase component I n=1 Tax=Aquibacillus koreensis TaxID=279446 RepID=A0A9X3WIJ7_9BACI|nr:aminodeoxychorismate synthase component I [Aquibacillus koreensis]MCT2535966.1 aminodeoxychorismate synthase component I [Aquibacillus koreensis]MDC3420422.1 aminodeoxychorismate synthase component I [Aquibacillus koreensis]